MTLRKKFAQILHGDVNACFLKLMEYNAEEAVIRRRNKFLKSQEKLFSAQGDEGIARSATLKKSDTVEMQKINKKLEETKQRHSPHNDKHLH